MKRTCAALFAFSLITACASTGKHGDAKHDNGIIGNPTPAVALYAAQTGFARKVCGLPPTKQNERFFEWAVRKGMMLDEYRRKDHQFAQLESEFVTKYQAVWENADEDKISNFCRNYISDVEWAKNSNRLKIFNTSDRFRSYFSPLSQERIELAKKANIALGVLSLGSTIASVNQARQGDFSSSQQLNEYGGVFAHSMGSPGVAAQLPCQSFMPFMMANFDADISYDSYYSIRECGKADK